VNKFDTEVRLSREMSLTDVTLIGMGAMIGADIFVLTGIAAGVAGPALVLAYLLNGVVTVFTAWHMQNWAPAFMTPGAGTSG
jgi:APA family basic amino acid/polyamine antiporter